MEKLHSGYQEKYDEVKDQRYLGEDSFIDRTEVEKKGLEEDLIKQGKKKYFIHFT